MKLKKFALAAPLVLVLLTPPARASDWGCEVLLCLANPAGPMALSACVPPIKKLFAAIFKFKPDPFPTCLMAGSGNSAGSTSIVTGYEFRSTGNSDVGAWHATYAPAIRVDVAGQPTKWFNITGGETKPYAGTAEDYARQVATQSLNNAPPDLSRN